MIHRSRCVDQNMHLSSRCSESTSPKRSRSSLDARWRHEQCADKNSLFRRFFTFQQNNPADATHQNFILRFLKHFIKGVVHFFIRPLRLRRIMSLITSRFRLLLFFLFALIAFLFIFSTSIFCMICGCFDLFLTFESLLAQY